MAPLRIENLVKRYFVHGRPVVVFDNFNLNIQSHAYVGIYGPAQSGKTTLLNLIAGLEKPDSGRIVIDDIDLTQLDELHLSRFRHQRLGIVSSNSKLLAGRTAVENIEIALLFRHPTQRQPRHQAEALLGRVGVYEQRDLATADLSDEAKKRTLIAKALVNEPRFLLCDAVADSLLAKSAEALSRFLKELSLTGMTILLTTCNFEIARQTDRLIRLPASDLSNESAAML